MYMIIFPGMINLMSIKDSASTTDQGIFAQKKKRREKQILAGDLKIIFFLCKKKIGVKHEFLRE